MQSAADWSIKIGRSFEPLPRTTNSLRSKLILSRLRAQSSETRSPPEKSSSMMARSRRPDSVSSGMASSSRSTSSKWRKVTCFLWARGRSTRLGSRELMPRRARYLRKPRRAMRWYD